MGFPPRVALSSLLLFSGMTGVVCAHANAGSDIAEAKTYLTRRDDGAWVERLAISAHSGMHPVSPGQGLDKHSGLTLSALWDAVLQAKAMTALATLPGQRPDNGQKLSDLVAPDQVRNWAEFIDPELALHWRSLAEPDGYSHAMLLIPAAGIDLRQPMVRWTMGEAVGEGNGNPWKNAVSARIRDAMSSQRAIQRWLTLPSPSPQSNPWLIHSKTYRY